MPTERLATPSELPKTISVHAGAPSKGPCVAKPEQCPSRNRGQPILSHGVPGGERWSSTAAAILERLPTSCRGIQRPGAGLLSCPVRRSSGGRSRESADLEVTRSRGREGGRRRGFRDGEGFPGKSEPVGSRREASPPSLDGDLCSAVLLVQGERARRQVGGEQGAGSGD